MVQTRTPARTRPRLREMANQKMAVVRTFGDPNEVGSQAIPALYGSVFSVKFARKRAGTLPDFKVGPLRARWPDFADAPKQRWHGLWGLPLPDDVVELPQKQPGTEVEVETWSYGTVAEVIHTGPYSAEPPTIEALRGFIRENGYEIAGAHEEEYLTRPNAKVQKTIIRYPVRRVAPPVHL